MIQSRGRTRGRTSRWGTRGRNGSASRERRERADELEVAIERRRWVYRHGLYAKVSQDTFEFRLSVATSRSTLWLPRQPSVWNDR